jgi:hypothetical protein
MGSLLRVRAALGVAIVSLMVVALAPPGLSAAQQRASLRITPGVYVGGQALTFTGNIGRSGVQRIRVQTHQGGPGDSWTEPEGGFSAWTNRDGSFKFRYPAPSMFGLRVRVASARAATPGQAVNARSQDLVLRAPEQVRPGDSFAIEVDTTPVLPRRPDLPGPAFPGRTLTLQQRVGNDWQNIDWKNRDTATTDGQGEGSFNVTAGAPGTVVYRVRQENYTANGNEIGWFPSFPTYVQVTGSSRSLTAPATSTTQQRSVQKASGGDTEASMLARATANGATASKMHSWGQSLWDFAWAFGESLTSRPYRGTDRHGLWRDASDGLGRVTPHNGQLMLDSQRGVDGPGDRGTTWATLRGNPMKYGRWEAKLRLRSPENNARDYRVRIELVPDRPGDYHCGAQNITVADVAAHGSSVTVGANALKGARKWTYRKRIGSLNGSTAAFAVEVTKRHISWFVNGRVIATVRSAAAVSDVPMTLRMVMAGEGQKEMNHTQAFSDWQRGFSLNRGRKVTRGHALRPGTYRDGC